MKVRTGNSLIRKVGFYVLFLIYLLGGINHLVLPKLYWPLIPSYFVYISELNILSGLAEIFLAIGLIFQATRKIASLGIILLLLAFIPSHIHFIEKGSCISNSICFAPWVAWVRLLVIHPLLIIWAYSYRNYKLK